MIQRVEVADVFVENTYFYIDDATGQGFIIDPGAEPERLYRIIRDDNLDIKAILLTHGHFDHTGAVQFLSEKLGVPYYISRPGHAYLTNPQLNLSEECGRYSVLPDAKFFKEDDFITLPDNPEFGPRVIAAPGHTPDSVIFYSPADQAAFVGDAIFRGAPGTSQFPGGDQRELFASITNIILRLPDATTLYSGHTPPTSVGAEKPNYLN